MLPERKGGIETYEPEHGINDEGAARLIHVRDLLKTCNPPEWRIRGIVEDGVLLMALGAAESAKSLWWQRAAVCVAAGTPMDGRAVKPGTVVYLCGEGRQGLQRRFKALEIDLGVSLDDAPLLVCFEGPSLCDAAAAERVKLAIDQATEKHGAPGLVIIDTLSRHMAGGDENRAADMAQFFANVRRAAPEATVAVVHHTGWIEGNRNRGSSAIRAAADQEMFFRKDGDLVTVTGGKQKDGDRPEDLRYRIKLVRTGLCREDGTPLDSVTLEPTDEFPQAVLTDTLGKNQRAALEVLTGMATDEQRKADAGETPYPSTLFPMEAWRAAMRKAGHTVDRRRWQETTSGLVKRRVIHVNGDTVSLLRGLQ